MASTTPWQRIQKVYDYSKCSSISDFARTLGLHRAENLFQIRRGNNGISLKLAETISAKYPNFSTGWLITGEGEPLADSANPSPSSIIHTIPFYTNFSSQSIEKAPDDLFPVSRNFFPDADYATILKGEWLEPRIPAGSLILLRASHKLIYGNHYFVELSTGDSLYRIVCKSENVEYVRLSSNNPAYDPIEIPRKEIAASYIIIGYTVLNSL